MKKIITILVLAFASGTAMAADDVWFNCAPINGMSVQVLKDATIVLTASNGVSTHYPTRMYNSTGSEQDYVTTDGLMIFGKRSNGTAIYDGRIQRISECSEHYSQPSHVPAPYNPDNWDGCPGCMNDGGYP